MAMTLPISPASDAHPASPGGAAANPNPADSAIGTNSNNNNSTNNNNTDDQPSSPTLSVNTNSTAAQSGQMKRKPSRRANTAERRATHNAVERQRRETLNGRFLDLASLLPNLSQIRRPSKSSIVNSSIAHIHGSRRHRLLASNTLRQVKIEADSLRREVNEWRDRAGIPRVEEPVRGEAFGIVLSGEMELDLVGIDEGEEGEDGMDEDGDDFGGPQPQQHQQQQQSANHGAAAAYIDLEEDVMPLSAGGYHHHHQQQQQQQMHAAMHAHHVQAMPFHSGHHQQQHQHQQHHLDELEDARMAAMLLKTGGHGGSGAGNPFAHNLPPPSQQQRAYEYYQRQGNAAGFGPAPGPYNSQGHLFTPPATAHGLPVSGPPTLSLSINTSRTSLHPNSLSPHPGSLGGSPSPVSGHSPSASALQHDTHSHHSGSSAHGSPVSSEHEAFTGGVSPVMRGAPKHGRRARSSSLSGESGGASPAYELQSHASAAAAAASQGHYEGVGVPRRGSMMEGYMGVGMGGMGMGGGMMGLGGGMGMNMGGMGMGMGVYGHGHPSAYASGGGPGNGHGQMQGGHGNAMMMMMM